MKQNKAERHTSAIIKRILAKISKADQHRANNRMLIAARIEDAIKEKKWTQNEFALRMEKQPSEISRWLSGTNNFTLDVLSDIETVLEVKLLETQIQKNSVKVAAVMSSLPASSERTQVHYLKKPLQNLKIAIVTSPTAPPVQGQPAGHRIESSLPAFG